MSEAQTPGLGAKAKLARLADGALTAAPIVFLLPVLTGIGVSLERLIRTGHPALSVAGTLASIRHQPFWLVRWRPERRDR